MLESLSKSELLDLASKGALQWKGKKIFVDPFIEVSLVCLIEQTEEQGFLLSWKITDGSTLENMPPHEDILPSGIVRGNLFRFWVNGIQWDSFKNLQPTYLIDLKNLSFLISKWSKNGIPTIKWNCPIPSWKPNPLPILMLTDRTGAFANLWMDYGYLGKVNLCTPEHPLTKEEIDWEKDLLETGFIKKRVGNSNYYCPTHKVTSTLKFLIELGWKVVDYKGKQIIKRQSYTTTSSLIETEELLIQGALSYGTSSIPIQQALTAFQNRVSLIDLTAHTTALLELPSEWMGLISETLHPEGVLIPRNHFGILEGIVPIPYIDITSRAIEVSQLYSTFKGTLFDYQLEGVNWLSNLYLSHFSALLADEMGLGKTIQVLAFLATLSITHPILIVTPLSLLSHWKRSFEQFLPTYSIYIHTGERRANTQQKLSSHQVILVSYGQLRRDHALFETVSPFEVVVIDEAQAIKNRTTLIAQCVYRLQARYKIAITGTPIENRLDDLFSIFHFLMPNLSLPMTVQDLMPNELENIRKKIIPFFLRRTKEQVALDLPEKQYQIVWIERDEQEQAFYETYLQEYKRGIGFQTSESTPSKRIKILEFILRLRQICCHPSLVLSHYQGKCSKFETVCHDILEVIESKQKILLYSQFTSILKKFKEWLDTRSIRYAYLDGATKEREQEINRFQNEEEVCIFLISLKAGGVGLNLQAADYVFLYDPWWNLSVEQQAIDRAHRLGKKGKVIARKYLLANTIEEKIWNLQQHKQSLFTHLMEGSQAPLTLDELYALINTD